MGIRRLWILGALFGLTILGGCSSKYAGTYEGRQPRAGAPDNMAETIAKIQLVLKPTGQFVYIRMGFPWEGEWSEEGGRIKLIVGSAMNKEASPLSSLGPGIPIVEPKEDGTLVVHDAFTKGGEGVVLTKSQPKKL